MACPVNAVEITASAMIAGHERRGAVVAERAERQQRQPDQQRDRDEHGQQQLLAVAQQQLAAPAPNCAASICGTALGRGSGVKVPGAKRFASSLLSQARHCRNSRPVRSRNTSSRLRCSTRMSVASTSSRAHHAVTVASTCGSIGPSTRYSPGVDLGGLVVLRQRRRPAATDRASRRRGEPQLVLGAAAHQLGRRAGGHRRRRGR